MKRSKTMMNDCRLDQEIIEQQLEQYPLDPFVYRLKRHVTYRNVIEDLNAGRDIYDTIGTEDSIIRERIFGDISDILEIDYDIVYQTWLHQRYILSQNGGYTDNPDYIDPETTPLIQDLHAYLAGRNSRTDIPERECPVCHELYRWEPFIWMKDGETEICPKCSFIQAVLVRSPA